MQRICTAAKKNGCYSERRCLSSALGEGKYFPRNGAVGTDSGRIANDAFVFFLDEIAVSVSVTLTWVADLILLIGLRNFLTSRADGNCFPICSQSVKKPSESVRGLRPLA